MGICRIGKLSGRGIMLVVHVSEISVGSLFFFIQ